MFLFYSNIQASEKTSASRTPTDNLILICLYKKYKPIGIDVLQFFHQAPIGIDVLQFFHQAPNLSIGNQDTLLEILKILSECLLESTE